MTEPRYNQHHGKDGKFASGSHVGAHGGTIAPKGGKATKVKGAGVALADAAESLARHHKDPSDHTDHPIGHVGEIKTNLIKFDPQRFQYKLGGQGEHGVTDALHGVRKFDPNLSGILQVWKDPHDRQTYVVNGHHRLDLANKLHADKVAVRFIGAKDAAEARGIGALTNIAEGRGTSLDAAKFFRDTGHGRHEIEAKGIPLKERVAHEGLALANLHKPIFDRVIGGELTAARGAIIGDGLDHAQQAAVVKHLDKFGKSRPISDATLRQTVQHARVAPKATVKTHDLFGDNEEDVSLAFHRGETSAHVAERLGREKRVFGTVAKDRNASDLQRGGNLINAGESGKISREAAQNLDTFSLLQHRKGPVSDLLNEAAERLHKGEKKKAVHDDIATADSQTPSDAPFPASDDEGRARVLDEVAFMARAGHMRCVGDPIGVDPDDWGAGYWATAAPIEDEEEGEPEMPTTDDRALAPPVDRETRETRYADGVELRAASAASTGPGTLIGYPIVYGRHSDLIADRGASKVAFREIVRAGACSRSIREHDIRAMADHDPAKVLGRNRSGTCRLSEDARGVKCEIDLPDTTAGRDTAVSVARGDLTGMSFGFRVAKEGESWERSVNPPVRHLHNLDIDDVSVVAYPAYPDTSVALRSLDRAAATVTEPEPVNPAETHAASQSSETPVTSESTEPDPESIRREHQRDRDRLRLLGL